MANLIQQKPVQTQNTATTPFDRLFKMGEAFYTLLKNYFDRGASAQERIAIALEQQNHIMSQMNLNIQTLTYLVSPQQFSEAVYPIYPIEWLKDFDFTKFQLSGRTVGAYVKSRDELGAKVVIYEGNAYVRRENPSKKMSRAYWFSRYVGMGTDGDKKFLTLVKFTEKPRSDAAALNENSEN